MWFFFWQYFPISSKTSKFFLSPGHLLVFSLIFSNFSLIFTVFPCFSSRKPNDNFFFFFFSNFYKFFFFFFIPGHLLQKLAQDIYSFLLNFQISFKLEANDKIPDFFNIFSTFFLNFFNFKQKKPSPFTHFFHIFKFRTIISVLEILWWQSSYFNSIFFIQFFYSIIFIQLFQSEFWRFWRKIETEKD